MSGSHKRLDIVPAPAIVATRADRDDAASAAPPVVASNVVLFTAARRETVAADNAPALPFDPAERPAPFSAGRDRRRLLAALVALSLLVHGGLYFIFDREPEPMASLGAEAISVDLIVGSNTPAGASGQSQAQAAPAEQPEQKPDTEAAKADPDAAPVETAPPETAPDQPKPEDPETPPVPPLEPAKQAAAPPADDVPTPREPQVSIALVAPTEPVKPEPAKPETKSEPAVKPVQKREPKQDIRQESKPKQARDANTRTASREPVSPHANAAGGTGPGRSQNYSNWIGTVYTHLSRYQRRNQAHSGLVVVRFSVDGSGRVTGVSLARSSGFSDLDQEAQGSVRRASPFPPPPLGVSNVTAPIRYRPAS